MVALLPHRLLNQQIYFIILQLPVGMKTKWGYFPKSNEKITVDRSA